MRSPVEQHDSGSTSTLSPRATFAFDPELERILQLLESENGTPNGTWNQDKSNPLEATEFLSQWVAIEVTEPDDALISYKAIGPEATTSTIHSLNEPTAQTDHEKSDTSPRQRIANVRQRIGRSILGAVARIQYGNTATCRTQETHNNLPNNTSHVLMRREAVSMSGDTFKPFTRNRTKHERKIMLFPLLASLVAIGYSAHNNEDYDVSFTPPSASWSSTATQHQASLTAVPLRAIEKVEVTDSAPQLHGNSEWSRVYNAGVPENNIRNVVNEAVRLAQADGKFVTTIDVGNGNWGIIATSAGKELSTADRFKLIDPYLQIAINNLN